MSTQGTGATTHFALLIAILALSSLTCSLMQVEEAWRWSEQPANMQAEEDYQHRVEAERLAREEYERQAHALSLTQTALAALQAQLAYPPTAPPLSTHAPSILKVDFPASIPANGTYVRGTVTFTDAGHDLERVVIQTIAGVSGSGSWDPTRTITWNGNGGTLPIEAGCGGGFQVVRAQVTLQDATGAKSDPAVFSFTCQ